MSAGLVLWFCGLSGSGKSTIAQGAAELLLDRQVAVKIVDGDVLRQTVGKHLGFSSDHVMESNNLAVQVCSELRQSCDVVLVPRVSPFKRARLIAREFFGDAFAEVYVRASIATVEARDPKGLYERARSGSGEPPIGLPGGLPFEAPEDPELVLDSENRDPHVLIKSLSDYITDWMERRGGHDV